VRRPGILITVATAWVGVVTGHLAAYLLAYPTQGPRHAHLVITGHEWIGFATVSLLAVVPVILLTIVLSAVRTAGSWSGGALALRLASIQVPAFALIEVLERGGSFGRTLTDSAVFVGLALQPFVAVLFAWLLGLVRQAARSVLARLMPAHARAPRTLPRPGLRDVPRRERLLFPARRRAPPLLRAA
jgi:hypothetical protein